MKGVGLGGVVLGRHGGSFREWCDPSPRLGGGGGGGWQVRGNRGADRV